MNLRRWLRPGIGVKRWLGVAFVGLTALALAGALAIRQLYREVEVDGPVQALIYVVTLQFLPYWVRAAVLVGVGAFLFVYGSYRVVRVLLGPFTESAEEPLVDLVYRRRLLARGPRIVAIGGGTGLATLLRGLKTHTANLTANTLFYWRVRAKVGGVWGAWSSVFTFTSGNPPSVPALTAPANNSLATGPSPLFDWANSTVSGAAVFGTSMA